MSKTEKQKTNTFADVTVIDCEITQPTIAVKKEKLVAIKDDTHVFCGGNGISTFVRNSKLRVKRVNANTTVVLENADTGAEVGTVFACDIYEV